MSTDRLTPERSAFWIAHEGQAAAQTPSPYPYTTPPTTHPEVFRQLAKDIFGKNLACWCPLDQPCHADVLLELANAESVGLSGRHAAS